VLVERKTATEKKKRKLIIIISIILALLIIGGAVSVISYKFFHHTTLNRPEYMIDIQFPVNETYNENDSTLSVKRGSQVNLPVTAFSTANTSIEVRLVLGNPDAVPNFITFTSRKDYVPIQPFKNVEITITFDIAAYATPGSYQIELIGDQKELPENYPNGGTVFYLLVTDSQS
jgi:hypothetical protein